MARSREARARPPAPPPVRWHPRPRARSVPHAEVRVDVAPPGRGPLELLAQLAHEHVDRPVAAGHRVAPHALVDLLALHDPALRLGEQLDELELAAREIHAAPPTKAWNWSARTSTSPASTGPAPTASRRAAPPHDGLHARDQLLRMARLGHPVVGAEPQPAHALGDGRPTGADHDAEPGQTRCRALEVVPALRAEHGEIDHHGPQAHRDDVVDRHGAGEHPVLPAGAVQSLRENLEESGVGVEHGEPDGRRRGRHLPRRIVGRHTVPRRG